MASQDIKARLEALTPQQREHLKRALAARRAGAAARPEETPPRSGIPRLPDAPDYALSFAQKRIWLQEQLIEGRTAAYNVSLALLVEGNFSPDDFERAARKVIEQHEILRTTIVSSGEEPRQRIRETVAFTLERWGKEPKERTIAGEGATLAPDVKEAKDKELAAFAKRANDFASRPFALGEDIPFRMAWMPLGDKRGGLAIVLHHIACDGSSIPVLIGDLARHYQRARQGGGDATDPASAVRYVDFAAWHRAWLESAAGRKAREYWMGRFAELPEPTELPADKPRPTVQDFAGGHLHHHFGRETTEGLRRVGKGTGASLFMTLHAVVVAYLQRCTGQADFTVGTPTEGRLDPTLERVVGFFVNTLPLRTSASPHDTFSSLLGRVREATLEGFENQGYPFDVLVESLPIERDMARPPLFNVMMGLTSSAEERLDMEGLRTTPVRLSGSSSKVDLTFHFVEGEEGLDLDLEYATALFSERRIRRLLGYFGHLVDAIIENPSHAVGDLPLVSDDEMRAQLMGSQPAWSRYPRDSSLAALFRAQARHAPQAAAVWHRGRTMTYAMLDRLSERFAARLRATLGSIPREEPIALQVSRSERMIVALLGILKTGACYLPLNPGTPNDRVRAILGRSGVRLRFVEGPETQGIWDGRDEDLAQWLPDEVALEPGTDAPAVLDVAREAHATDRCGAAEAAAAGSEADPGTGRSLAYIIFTSGSTGEPKGVQVEQRSVARLVLGTDYLQFGPGDRVLQTGSLAFDASTFEIWGPLLNGGCCCLPEGNEILEAERFGDLLSETGATTCFLTTGLFNQFADFSPQVFSRLKHVLTGGEKVSVAHINRVLEAAPGIDLLHVYGPTENTTFSSWHRVSRPAEHDVPIGRAIAHSTLYVVDARGNALPPGITGEILCGGEGLARGYLGRPDLTAERFVPDSFCGERGARLYRTGDYGRWNEDGAVEFVGRTDDQVKVRGFRIELGEIELRLRACKGVRQAVVIARPLGGTHELVAYVVCDANGLDESGLRSGLAGALPDYMIPSRFVFLEELPLNASGKVDRRALPAPVVQTEIEGRAQWRGEREILLAGVWREVLGRAPSDKEEHYFNAGGDSIKAIQMSARLRAKGWKLTLRDVFAHPRFGEMAGALLTAGVAGEAMVEECGDIPLTPIQAWFVRQHRQPFDRFNQATLFEMEERIDADRMKRALTSAITRHGMLRCRLRQDADGCWTQSVERSAPDFLWRELDVRAMDAEAAREAYLAVADTMHAGLSLQVGRLMAAGLVRGTDRDRLLLIVHHWAIDGLSWRILVEDLSAFYRAPESFTGAVAEAEQAPKTSAPFRAWAEAVERYAKSDAACEELGYWTSLGKRTPGWRLDGEPIEGGSQLLEFDEAFTRHLLKEANAPYGTQVTEVLLAAFGRTWLERAGEPALLLAMEGHGRESCVANLDVSRTVGWFTSLWPFLLENEGEWSRLLRSVRDSLRSVPERGIGYLALRHCGDEVTRAKLAELPEPQVSFNYLGEFVSSAQGSTWRVCSEETGDGYAAHLRTSFALDVVAEVVDGRLRLGLHFRKALFDAAGRREFARSMESSLRACVEHCLHAAPRRSLADFTGGVSTLAALDRQIDEAAARGQEIEDLLPLTPMQEGMVFHARLEPASDAYSDQVILRVEGALDPALFERAWQELGRQHPNLRAVFCMTEDGKLVGQVLKGSVLGFRYVDLERRESQDTSTALRTEERMKPFDLYAGPLLRLTLIRRGNALHEAILGFHHSIIDGWSSALLWRQLEENYRALRDGAARRKTAASFTEYLRWLGKRDRTAELAAWRGVLDGCPEGTAVPIGGRRLGLPRLQTRSVSWEFGAERSAAMARVARVLTTTESSLFQALWGVFLGKITRANDVVFGVTVSGRNDRIPGVETMIGLLINTIPVRVRWNESTTFGTLAESTHRQVMEALDRSSIGLAELQSAVLERGVLARHTLVIENYPGEEDGQERLWTLSTEEIHDPMHFEFGMIVVPRKDGWICRLVADRNLHPDSHLEGLRKQWLATVDSCLAKWQQPVDSWSIAEAVQGTGGIVVAATFTAEPLAEALEFWLEACGRAPALRFSPFNQVLQVLLDRGSELYGNQDGANLILIRLEDWAGQDRSNPETVEQCLENAGDLLVDGLRSLASEKPHIFHCILFCPSAPDPTIGGDLARRLERAEERLCRRIGAMGRANVQAVPSSETMQRLPIAQIYSTGGEALGGIPYEEDYYSVLATEFVRRWDARCRAPLKVLALDADNTLWRGIVGEDGVDGLAIEPGHRKLQESARRLGTQGWLLALVTKNNPQDIEAVFRNRSDMGLAREDFVAIEADWRPKSESLRLLAERLGLGLDAFVFVDDSAMECAEVRASHPEMHVLQVPTESEALARFADHVWLWDSTALTEEDRRRSAHYRMEAERRTATAGAAGIRAFVQQLELNVSFLPIDGATIARAAQLTQRTNQFNATTRRRSEDALRSLMGKEGVEGFVVDVKDRFGTYGITGCVLYTPGPDVWELDTFLLSCRVLGRGVEHAVLRHLGERAASAGAAHLRIPFQRTQRNAPAERFLKAHASECLPGVEGEIYVFNTAHASALEIVEDNEPRDEQTPAHRQEMQSCATPASWWFYERVATHLSDAFSLCREIRGRRQRRRNRGAAVAYEAPRGHEETTISKVWAEVLGIGRVGRRDHFFALGGHSLTAVMMLARLQRLLETRLTLEDVFESPVLGDFATKAGTLASKVRTAGQELRPVPGGPYYPLSHAQRRLWMMEQMRGDGPSPFHMTAVFRVAETVGLERLEEALNRIVSRHESLRTGLRQRDGNPVQVVESAAQLRIQRLAEVGGCGDAHAAARAFAETDFDLSSPPLLRVGWIPEHGKTTILLCIVMHHVISDGWSIGVLADELAASYSDPRWAPPSLPIQYKDYAAWQTARQECGDWEPHRVYWKERFAILPPPLDLPSDRPRLPVKQTHGAEVAIMVDSHVWQRARAEAFRMGGSPFMAVVSIVQIVLARQARKQRFAIGTPVAGRDLEELEQQIGFYVNLVPLLCEIDPEATFEAHFAAVRSSTAAALGRASYPFDELVDTLNLPRDMSRTPLFDTLIVFQNNRQAELRLGDSRIEPVPLPTRTSQYDLTFEFAEARGGLYLRIEYDSHLYDEARIIRLASHVSRCMEAAFARPETPVSRIPLCPSDEIERLIRFERGPGFGSRRDVCLHRLVEEAAVHDPEAAAIIEVGRRTDYRTLLEQARLVAAGIAAAGVAGGAVVAVAGRRECHFIAAMLGIMRAGCIYLPIELKHPDARLKTILEDSGARHGIAVGEEADRRLRNLGLQLVSAADASEIPEAVRECVNSEATAYLIYTSGSTGRPKGVEISHRAFATMIGAQIAAFGVRRTDRCAWWASCAFDASLSEVFLALASGAAVAIATEAEREDPDRFLAWLRGNGVTVATLPPAFLRVLRRTPLEPLRVLITAGEAAHPDDARHYSKALHYFNAYGPTETAVCATVHRVLSTDEVDEGKHGECTDDGSSGEAVPRMDSVASVSAVPIGRPLDVASVYVLDENGARAPIGVPGELCIGGWIVGSGYRGAPDATAARFVEDPFAGFTEARMYRTGDLARWREDGLLEFLGREDDQIKIRGFRVELREIETILRSTRGVLDAAVVYAKEDSGAALIAYLVAETEALRSARETVARTLPDYMHPAAYVPLSVLPTTPNGKLDKAALPKPRLQGEDADHAIIPPADEREASLAEAWRDVLGCERIGRKSDFFACGGDSIKALMLVSRIRRRGWELNLKTIYAHPQLAEQAHLMNAAVAADTSGAATIAGEVPLLPIQKWFLEAHADSPLHHFNQAVRYRARERIRIDLLQKAIAAVWRRHPALRAIFSKEGGSWTQRILPESVSAPGLAVLDLAGTTDIEAREKEDFWIKNLQETFDLGRGPLIRYGLVRMGDGSEAVVCATHHLVSDWVSHRLLLADLAEAYQGAQVRGGSEQILQRHGTGIDLWSETLVRWAQDRAARAPLVDGWRRLLEAFDGVRPLAPAGRHGDVSLQEVRLSEPETKRLLERIASVPGTTVRDLLLAAIAHATKGIFGGAAAAVMLEGHGRDVPVPDMDGSHTVGWFTSLYPFLARAHPGESWRAAVSRLRSEQAALPQGGAAYAWLRAYGALYSLPEACTQIGLNYLGAFGSDVSGTACFRLDDALPVHAIAPSFERDHAIEVSGWISGGRLSLLSAHARHGLPDDVMARWFSAVRDYLAVVCDEGV